MCSKLLIYFARILCLFLFVSNSWCAAPIFQLLNTYSSGGYSPSSVALADVNGDGTLDVIVANRCATSDTCSDGGTVGVLLGNGDGTLQPVHTYNSGGLYASFVTVSDLNGDGRTDLIVANSSMAPGEVGGIGILFGNGDGTFQPAVSFASNGSPINGLAVADFNHDGIPDIAIANWSDPNWYYSGTVSVLLGTGGGKFQAAQTYSSGYWTNSVVAADVNGDGAADLLVGDSGSVSVLLGVGDGTFQPAIAYPSGGHEGCWIAVADVNGDGKLDLVAANQFGPHGFGGSTVAVLLGKGDGSFQSATRYWTAYAAGTLAVADLNRDNKLDILVTGDKLDVFWGGGDGTFRRAPGMPFYRGTIAVGDVDGDTRPDVVQAVNDQVNVLRNVIPFSTTTELTSNVNPASHGQPVTFTANVTPSRPYEATGKVKFRDGTTAIGSATLRGGVATLTKSNLAVGTHSITAQYAGDANSAKSTSPVLNQVVVQ
jgi:Bacterial Ig-like domain (group 3)/FG-GAP-like repeat